MQYYQELCMLHLIVISYYDTTNAIDETDITTFYNGQSSFTQYIPKHNILIASGDMNAQINKENNKFG